MILRFLCPSCERPGRLDASQRREWQCPGCDHRLSLHGMTTAGEIKENLREETLPACMVCGNTEIYKKKGFPHWLGLTILTVACLAFLVSHYFYLQYWAWGILLGSAAFDGALYLLVPDVLVCYRCGTHYSGIQAGEEHKPFELVIGERYRQERIRRQQRNLRSVP